MLVHRVDNPVNSWVAADGIVTGVDENDLKILVGRILVNPV